MTLLHNTADGRYLRWTCPTASVTAIAYISAVRFSGVASSIPRWIFRQTRSLGPPCLREFQFFFLDLDARAVDHLLQQSLGTPICYVHGEGFLAAGKYAEVGHRPVKIG